jgi:hypothetical protein
MKIEICIEPFQMDNSNIELRYRIIVGAEIFQFQEIMENDWFQDKSVFRRIVESSSYRLQKLYQDKNNTGSL